MNETLAFIKSLMKPEEQWPMSSIENEPGMSLPEYHPEEPEIIPDAPLAAEDKTDPNELVNLIADMLRNQQQGYQPAKADDLTAAFDKLLQGNPETKAKAQVGMYEGALLKTVSAASDLFSKAVQLGFSGNISRKRDVAIQNYQNQMDAIDNQVMYIKHQLADRFNKTVETNIAQMAARNLRVTTGNVLELSKEEALEISEDMSTADSNARLKKIALNAGKEQAKESAKYAKSQLWTSFAQSALKLGLMYETGGGTHQSFGDLYKGYMQGKGYLNNKALNEIS